MPMGTVKFFSQSKGFGFIIDDAGGADAFVHITAVEASGMHTLEQNQRIAYDLENDNHGRTAAVNIRTI